MDGAPAARAVAHYRRNDASQKRPDAYGPDLTGARAGSLLRAVAVRRCNGRFVVQPFGNSPTETVMSEPDTLQILTFCLHKDIFGIRIDRVQEVVELSHVTHLPRTPSFVRGLLNLRGHVIPVIDLRNKLGLGPTPDTIDTCVIVSEVVFATERTRIGALADCVREVAEVESSTLVPAPTLGTLVRSDFVEGLARQGDDLVMILDFDTLFAGDDLSLPEGAQSLTMLMGEESPTASASGPL